MPGAKRDVDAFVDQVGRSIDQQKPGGTAGNASRKPSRIGAKAHDDARGQEPCRLDTATCRILLFYGDIKKSHSGAGWQAPSGDEVLAAPPISE
jgi:hypothetical protein